MLREIPLQSRYLTRGSKVSNFLSWMFPFLGRGKNKMTFELKLEGLRESDLVEIEGVNGPFYVKLIGMREELTGGRFYGDANCQFFFYSRSIKDADGSFHMDVYTATTKRLDGPLPILNYHVLDEVRENIKILFLTRDINFPNKPAPARKPSKIVFSWGLAS